MLTDFSPNDLTTEISSNIGVNLLKGMFRGSRSESTPKHKAPKEISLINSRVSRMHHYHEYG